jgi:hypothetical protein
MPRFLPRALSRRTALSAALPLVAISSRPALAREPVDLSLVLAVDVSRSIDDDEAKLQRQGYIDALTSPRVLGAIRGGLTGSIAVAYIEWAGWEYQRLVIPWTRIRGAADAQRFTDAIAEAPRVSMSWTSVSGALAFSLATLEASPYEGTRSVIDVSGDGVNNSGPPAEVFRDRAIAEGITINGLPIINDRPTFGRLPPMPLDVYYRESVIGGPGAFMVVAEDFASFGQAVLRKLVREISEAPVPTPPGAGV